MMACFKLQQFQREKKKKNRSFIQAYPKRQYFTYFKSQNRNRFITATYILFIVTYTRSHNCYLYFIHSLV